MKATKFLSKEKWETIIERIKDGDFYSDIAKDYGITTSAISYQAKKRNVGIGARYRRKNNLDVDFFNNIDSEEKAYWLGFITADGGVCYTTDYYKSQNKPNRLYIQLSSLDVDHLKKFAENIKCSTGNVKTFIPIGTYSGKEMCALKINSVKMCKDLKTYGIVPKKTGIEQFSIIDSKLMNHYIRGFMDGDGSVYARKNRNNSVISFCGNKEFLTNLRDYLFSIDVIDSASYKICEDSKRNLFSFKFSKRKSVIKYYEYIYNNATIYLNRKKDKFII